MRDESRSLASALLDKVSLGSRRAWAAWLAFVAAFFIMLPKAGAPGFVLALVLSGVVWAAFREARRSSE